MARSILVLMLLFAVGRIEMTAGQSSFGRGPAGMEEGFVPLFNYKDFSEWTSWFEKVGPNKDDTMKLADFCVLVPSNVYAGSGANAGPVARDTIIRCKTTDLAPGR